MSRYIDADKITYMWQYDADGEEHDGVTLQSIIRKLPTADVVEVRQVNNLIRRLQNIPGAIYHSELKQACEEFGFDYLGIRTKDEKENKQ